MPKYRVVSAAEKDGELQAQGLERPRCVCHGDTMNWGAHDSCRAGGYWRCRITARERSSTWSRANKEATNARQRRLGQTPGTYLYKKRHGIGMPGSVARAAANRHMRRKRNEKDMAILSELKDKYPEIWEAVNG